MCYYLFYYYKESELTIISTLSVEPSASERMFAAIWWRMNLRRILKLNLFSIKYEVRAPEMRRRQGKKHKHAPPWNNPLF
jgi:hypothetical protein